MKIRNGCVLSGVALLMLAGAGMAQAQEKDAKPSATPAAGSQPAAEMPANPAEAKAVLDKVRAAYKAVHTYQDKAKLKFEMKAKGPDGEDQNQSDTQEVTFAYAGAHKFAMVHKDFAIYSDGQNQTAHVGMLNQYVQRPAQDGIIDEAKIGPIGVLSAMHAPANLLIEPAKFEKEFPLLHDVTGVKAEELDGKAGKRVYGQGSLPDMEDTKIPVTVWIADETNLVGEVTMDLKGPTGEQMGEGAKIDKAMGTISFSEIQLNSEVPADKYTFKPGASDKKVDSFGADEGPDPQKELVGKASPDFKGTDLEGKALNLSDYKGKILVLDFWATWCGPCMQAIPKIQELSTEYAEKGVVVIGMNQDTEDAKDKVKQTVEKKKLTFRQFMDSTQSVAEQFKVSGIPCTVVLDGKGTIQWIHTGYTPSMKKEIGEALDKLIKGESLVKAEPDKK